MSAQTIKNMQPSKVQLERYFVEEASFSLRNRFFADLKADSGPEPDDLKIEVRLGKNKEDSRRRFCELKVKLKESSLETAPFVFKIVMVGFFKLSEDCSEKETEILMTNTAPSVLYSAAREYLLIITGRSRYLPVLLPTVTFFPKRRVTKEEIKERIAKGQFRLVAEKGKKTPVSDRMRASKLKSKS
jgi:preprotein translocase subunit SecB